MTEPDFNNHKPAEIALEATNHALEHYMRHHEVVLRKLRHAHEATVTSIRELEAMLHAVEEAAEHGDLAEVRKYDGLWEGIINTFRHAGISEDELSRVEDVLLDIPRAIRVHYDELIRQDQTLQKMIADLGADKYKRAFAIIREAQSAINPMSGLPADEYDIDEDKDEEPETTGSTNDNRVRFVTALPIRKDRDKKRR